MTKFTYKLERIGYDDEMRGLKKQLIKFTHFLERIG